MFDIIKAPKMICTPFTGCPGKWVHIKKGAFIVYYRCYRPRLVTGRGCIKMLEIFISFIVSIIASIISYYICKWLDRY